MKKKISLMMLSVLILSGCQHIENFDTVAVPREPIVTKAESRFVVGFDYASSKLNKIERERIENFVMQYEVSRQDDLVVFVAEQGGNVAQKRSEKVAAYLRGLGLKPMMKWGNAKTGLQEVEVSLGRYTVQVPNCPDWSDGITDKYNNQVHSNFGCAQAANLALMIADPRDLIQGRESSPVDGQYLSNAMQAYHTPPSEEGDGENVLQIPVVSGGAE